MLTKAPLINYRYSWNYCILVACPSNVTAWSVNATNLLLLTHLVPMFSIMYFISLSTAASLHLVDPLLTWSLLGNQRQRFTECWWPWELLDKGFYFVRDKIRTYIHTLFSKACHLQQPSRGHKLSVFLAYSNTLTASGWFLFAILFLLLCFIYLSVSIRSFIFVEWAGAMEEFEVSFETWMVLGRNLWAQRTQNWEGTTCAIALCLLKGIVHCFTMGTCSLS